MFWMLREWDCCPSKDQITQQPTVMQPYITTATVSVDMTHLAQLCTLPKLFGHLLWTVNDNIIGKNTIHHHNTVYFWCAVDVLKLFGVNHRLSFQWAAIFSPLRYSTSVSHHFSRSLTFQHLGGQDGFSREEATVFQPDHSAAQPSD